MKWAMVATSALGLALASPALADRNSYVPGAPTVPDTALSGQALNDGWAAVTAGQPQRAVTLMQPVLAQFDQRFATEKRQIYCSITPEQTLAYLAMAAKAKRDAIAIEQGWCRAQYINAFALVDLKRMADAEAAFRKLTEYAPLNARYLSELGFALQAQRKWAQSNDAYARAEANADLAPEGAARERCVALRGQGYNLVEMGKLDEAEAAYRKCLAITPDDPNSKFEIEYIQGQRKKLI